MRLCCIKYCRSCKRNGLCSYKDGKKISFFQFPEALNEREAWLKAVHGHTRHNITSPLHSYVCSLHFTPDAISVKHPSGRARVKPDAVPTIFSYVSNFPTIDLESTKSESFVRDEGGFQSPGIQQNDDFCYLSIPSTASMSQQSNMDLRNKATNENETPPECNTSFQIQLEVEECLKQVYSEYKKIIQSPSACVHNLMGILDEVVEGVNETHQISGNMRSDIQSTREHVPPLDGAPGTSESIAPPPVDGVESGTDPTIQSTNSVTVQPPVSGRGSNGMVCSVHCFPLARITPTQMCDNCKLLWHNVCLQRQNFNVCKTSTGSLSCCPRCFHMYDLKKSIAECNEEPSSFSKSASVDTGTELSSTSSQSHTTTSLSSSKQTYSQLQPPRGTVSVSVPAPQVGFGNSSVSVPALMTMPVYETMVNGAALALLPSLNMQPTLSIVLPKHPQLILLVSQDLFRVVLQGGYAVYILGKDQVRYVQLPSTLPCTVAMASHVMLLLPNFMSHSLSSTPPLPIGNPNAQVSIHVSALEMQEFLTVMQKIHMHQQTTPSSNALVSAAGDGTQVVSLSQAPPVVSSAPSSSTEMSAPPSKVPRLSTPTTNVEPVRTPPRKQPLSRLPTPPRPTSSDTGTGQQSSTQAPTTPSTRRNKSSVSCRHVRLQVDLMPPVPKATPSNSKNVSLCSPFSPQSLCVAAFDEVIRHLSTRDRATCRLVCRAWLRLVDSSIAWRNVELSNVALDVSQPCKIKAASKFLSQCEHLCLTWEFNPQSKGLPLSQLPKVLDATNGETMLQQLSLRLIFTPSRPSDNETTIKNIEIQLVPLLETLSSLKRLRISAQTLPEGLEIEWDGFDFVNSSITHLTLDNVPRMCSVLKLSPVNLPQLTTLELDSFQLVQDLPFFGLTHINHLRLLAHGASLQIRGVEWLSKLQSLRSIVLDNFMYSSEVLEVLKALQSLEKLEKLSLRELVPKPLLHTNEMVVNELPMRITQLEWRCRIVEEKCGETSQCSEGSKGFLSSQLCGDERFLQYIILKRMQNEAVDLSITVLE